MLTVLNENLLLFSRCLCIKIILGWKPYISITFSMESVKSSEVLLVIKTYILVIYIYIYIGHIFDVNTPFLKK